MPLTCAHLVGSLPYPDADTTFTEIAGRLGGHLKRIPDGETGERARWIFWQRAKVADHPAMEVATDEDMQRIHQWDGKLIREWELFRFRADVDPATVDFDPGYAPDAIRLLCPLPGDARGRNAAGRGAFPGLPADADGDRLLVRRAVGAAGFLRRLRARLQGRPGEYLCRHPARRPGDPVGRLPGGAGLGGAISRAGRRATRKTLPACWRASATPCRRQRSSATICATARRTTSMS